MFLGTYLVSVTSGKRTSIPVVFRQKLGQKVVIAKWYENCLVLVGIDSWSALLKRLTGGEKLVIEPIRGSEHFVFTSAYEVEVDEQGRIVLPDRLVAYAELTDQVYFLGVGDRVEIWNKEVWDKREIEITKDAPEYVEQIAKKNAEK